MEPDNITEIDWKLLKEKYPNDLDKVLKKLEQHYPIQYLIGDVPFLDTTIKVDERALIPRFETEYLVKKTIEYIKTLNLAKPKIIDLGTGSGCIAIALQKELNTTITGVEKNSKTLSLAKENAKMNKVTIIWQEKDMTTIKLTDYDVIISNPPYIATNILVGKETKWEPQEAIFAKENGLYFYKRILENIQKQKAKPKLIAFEIGYEQGNELKKLKEQYLPTYDFLLEQDLSGKDRYVFLMNKIKKEQA